MQHSKKTWYITNKVRIVIFTLISPPTLFVGIDQLYTVPPTDLKNGEGIGLYLIRIVPGIEAVAGFVM